MSSLLCEICLKHDGSRSFLFLLWSHDINVLTLSKLPQTFFKDKRVIVRCDLNVPIRDGVITSEARIVASLPTIELVSKLANSVLVMSHLGRPKPGDQSRDFSLALVAKRLGELLGRDVPLLRSLDESVQEGGIALLENVRLFPGETDNARELAEKLSSKGDIFVMDAFGSAHRQHASTFGIAELSDTACAGLLLEQELFAISEAMESPQVPMISIVGGSKTSTKLEVLNSLSQVSSRILVGGGILNTFLAASGFKLGRSLYEPDLIDVARDLSKSVEVPLPRDVIVSTDLSRQAKGEVKLVDEVGTDEMILDIGPVTAREWAKVVNEAKTILWNGPIGVFEYDQFGEGTRILAEAVAESPAFSLAGGGDTIAALEKYGVASDISYISTGGGAFLEMIEGKKLPGVEILERKAAQI